MLEKKHFTIMEMKYQGYKYADIAMAVEMHETTIAEYFGKGGILEYEYDSYVREQNKAHIDQAVEMFKQNANLASDVMNKVLQRAVKGIETAEQRLVDYHDHGGKDGTPGISADMILALEAKIRSAERRAFEFAQIILDRAGLPVVLKSQVETKKTADEGEEDVNERLKRSGIDPASIRYISSAPPVASKPLQV
jgi:hypothetical protein